MKERILLPNQAVLAEALADPEVYGDQEGQVEMLETHISYIFLADAYAYKVKKALKLGFLDFSTLEKRRYYCEQELRLNRRLAPTLYLEVIPITGTCANPLLGGEGTAIEYAVKMRRFAQHDLLNALLARGRLTHSHIDRLAEKMAGFHQTTAIAQAHSEFGSADLVRQPVVENFRQLRDLPLTLPCARQRDVLEQWSLKRWQVLEPVLSARKADGFIRECHGDFHLGNIAVIGKDVVIFDCLEFNDELRWIDVMNDIAFLVMDCRERGSTDLAQRFLNLYLEMTGDYAGLMVLQFYIVYRAMVRAKVHAMRASQGDLSPQQRIRALEEFQNYVAFALKQSESADPAVLVTHGVSGSGKTVQTQHLLETINAVRIRSDIERKRQYGLKPADHSGSGVGSGLYRPQITEQLYKKLLGLAMTIVEAGYAVIVDATFLAKWQRSMFQQLAVSQGIPFLILDFNVPEALLRARIHERLKRGGEASEANIVVLEYQLKMQEALQGDELVSVVSIDAAHKPAKNTWDGVLCRLGYQSHNHAALG